MPKTSVSCGLPHRPLKHYSKPGFFSQHPSLKSMIYLLIYNHPPPGSSNRQQPLELGNQSRGQYGHPACE